MIRLFLFSFISANLLFSSNLSAIENDHRLSDGVYVGRTLCDAVADLSEQVAISRLSGESIENVLRVFEENGEVKDSTFAVIQKVYSSSISLELERMSSEHKDHYIRMQKLDMLSGCYGKIIHDIHMKLIEQRDQK